MTLNRAPSTASALDDPATVIIPAHNEEKVIVRALRTLLAEAEPGEMHVMVACNGCTDATEAVARRTAEELCRDGHDITVITSPVASKAAAIRAAEALVTGFPRVYLDADVLCTTVAVRAMVDAVRGGAALAVPTRVLDTSSATAPARAYYAGWGSLPWVQNQLAGRGAYAVGRALRESFGEFPDEVADDRYVTTRGSREDAVIVPEPVVVRPPGRLPDVLHVRTRVYAGNLTVDGPAHDVGRAGRLRGLARLVVAQPSLVPALAIFSATTVLAKVIAGLAARRGAVTWGRDAARGGGPEIDAGREPPRTPDRAAMPDPASAPDESDARSPVDIVVLTYRSAGYVAECLRAADAALDDVPGARIIVVDNDSRDGIAEAVAGISQRIQLLERNVNDGFARGCHAGAAVSRASRLLFVNPDAVLDPGAVKALLRCSRTYPRAGIIGGRSVTEDGVTDPRSWWGRPSLWSAICFATGLSSVFRGSRYLDPESPEWWRCDARTVAVVSGGMMLVEREAWEILGGFDQDFFLYGEDADLSLRAARAGWSPRVCPEAVYRHRVGASSTGSNRLPLVLRGRVTTYRKNLPAPWGRVAGELLVLGTGVRALAAGLRHPGGRPAMGVAAWRDTWRRRAEWRDGWLPGDLP